MYLENALGLNNLTVDGLDGIQFYNASSLSSNSSSTAENVTSSKYVLKYDAINTIDNISRISSLFVHVVYFLIVLTHRELMTINLFHMHHVNIIGLMVAIHYCCWINSVTLNLPNQTANNVLCSMAEAFFAVFRFARMYAVLVLAVHRVIAVFFVSSYKEVSESIKYTVLSAALVWVAGILVFVAGKYGGHTVPGGILCIDGSSPFLINSIIYYIITSSFGFIIPFVVVIVFYKMITNRLSQIYARLYKVREGSSNLRSEPQKEKRCFHLNKILCEASHNSVPDRFGNSPEPGLGQIRELEGGMEFQEPTDGTANGTSTDDPKKKSSKGSSKEFVRQIKDNKREKKLTKQFLQINLYEAGSAVALISLYITNTIPNFSANYYWFRQASRATNLMFQSIIPIATLVHHPFRFRLYGYLKKMIF